MPVKSSKTLIMDEKNPKGEIKKNNNNISEFQSVKLEKDKKEIQNFTSPFLVSKNTKLKNPPISRNNHNNSQNFQYLRKNSAYDSLKS